MTEKYSSFSLPWAPNWQQPVSIADGIIEFKAVKFKIYVLTHHVVNLKFELIYTSISYRIPACACFVWWIDMNQLSIALYFRL